MGITRAVGGKSTSIPVADVVLEPAPLDESQIVSGSPEVSSAVLQSAGWCERGVWQITPGVVTDVEGDELFVVVSGRATVEVLDPETGSAAETLELAPGCVGLFARVRTPDGRCTRRCARSIR